MEEKKNNAVEKVENVIKEKQAKTAHQAMGVEAGQPIASGFNYVGGNINGYVAESDNVEGETSINKVSPSVEEVVAKESRPFIDRAAATDRTSTERGFTEERVSFESDFVDERVSVAEKVVSKESQPMGDEVKFSAAMEANVPLDKKEQKRLAKEAAKNKRAEERALKKAERQKEQANALKEKNRKRQLLREQQKQLAAERERRRKEEKAHKEQMKIKEQARRDVQMIEAKRQKQLKRQEQKAERIRLRKEERKARRQKRESNVTINGDNHTSGGNGNNGGNRRGKNMEGGWISAVVALGLATLVLTGVLTYNLVRPETNGAALENVYRRSFYDTVEQVDNIDLNLSKIIATKDNDTAQTYLVDLAINSELAENDLSSLPLKDENKFYTTKLVNQIGDYAKYLNNKLIDGGTLSSKDRQSLKELYEANKALRDSLQKSMQSMGADFDFTALNKNTNSFLVDNFNQLENLSVEYPELIYDGPFSDGQEDRTLKGVSGNEVSEAEARDIFTKIFNDRGLKDIRSEGTTESIFECYNFSAMADGAPVYAQITKKGGKLVLFNSPGSCNAENYGSDYAIEKAQQFLSEVGLQKMSPVWINLSNNVYTINFAYEQNGVVCYPDLVKVRVCAETADVLGLEATSYYINHHDRTIGGATLSEAQARQKVMDEIEIDSARLSVVPVGNYSEKLCYEFSGSMDGDTYYVYIDAKSGRQVEMFKVIESTEGTLLM